MTYCSFVDSRRLSYFFTVYQLGSIGHAAETLPLTQPALSKSIRQLEQELGCELFERTPSGVVPTVFGEALAHYARTIAAEIDNAKAKIAELRGGDTGEVRIGVGPSIAVNMMPMVTRQVHAERHAQAGAGTLDAPGDPVSTLVVEPHPVDERPVLRQSESARTCVAARLSGTHGSDFREAEAQILPETEQRCVLIEAGREPDGILETKAPDGLLKAVVLEGEHRLHEIGRPRPLRQPCGARRNLMGGFGAQAK